jgi:hypothetical protein
MALHRHTGDVVVIDTNNDARDPAEFAREFLTVP